MNLGGFIDTFKDAIARRVVESYPPLYRPSENGGRLPRLLRKPLGAQADAIRGAALSLKAHRGTTVVGEMGTVGRAPLDTAVRLRGSHRRQARRRRHRGRAQQQAAQVPQGGPGAARPRAQRVVPHHREHGVPAPRGRGLRPA